MGKFKNIPNNEIKLTITSLQFEKSKLDNYQL